VFGLSAQQAFGNVPWSRMGIFDRILGNLAAKSGTPDRVMIESTHLKSHRTAASL
jgi:hypothetical protein